MELKDKIHKTLMDILERKVEETKKTILLVKESMSDTKSSAGDKHETGRALMQIELDKNESHLIKTMRLKKELSLLKTKKEFCKVEFGSLVITNYENYYISIGLGKLNIDNENYYAISLASPIGQVIQNKTVGDVIHFQNREIMIQEIV